MASTAQRYGVWTGKYKCYKLRNELRYQWMDCCALLRAIGTAFPRIIWKFETDPADPLTYTTPTGIQIRIGDMETDFGSVPLMFQWLIQSAQFLLSFLFHDFQYWQNGVFMRRLAVSEPVPEETRKLFSFLDDLPILYEEWDFITMTRAQVDHLLFCGVGSEGGNAVQRTEIYTAVNIGGAFVWTPRVTGEPLHMSELRFQGTQLENEWPESDEDYYSAASPDDLE